MKLAKGKVGGLNFFHLQGDKTIGERILLQKFEVFETYLMKSLCSGKGMAVDVGANIGYYTTLLSRLYSKVIAFEPDPTSLKILRKNLSSNGINNVQVYKMAVSNKSESLSLGLSNTNLGDHHLNPKDPSIQKISVETIPLDMVIKNKVSLLKIDTQGWEPNVIMGAKNVIKNSHPIIFMEFWPKGYRRSGLKFKKMIDFLEKEYEKIYLIDDFLEIVYPVRADTLVNRCLTNKGYADLLFIRSIKWKDRIIFFSHFNFKKYIKKLLGLQKP